MAIGITVTRQDHPELVTQLQHEAEDFIAQYGNLFEHPSQIRPGPLQLRTKTLVQRIPKARDRNAVPFPIRVHTRSRRGQESLGVLCVPGKGAMSVSVLRYPFTAT